MIQEIYAENTTDETGNPAGGHAVALGLRIIWQDGPLGRGADRIEPNGAFVETVIAAAKQRIEFYQRAADKKFWCEENSTAIHHLELALQALEKRTNDREARSVEGTHTA